MVQKQTGVWHMTIADIEKAREVEVFGNVKIPIPESLNVVIDKESIPTGSSVFRIMSPKTGDTRVVWDAFNLDEVKDAGQMFKSMIDQGMMAMRVGVDGQATSEEIKAFDSSAEEVIFIPRPAIVGG